MNTSTVKIASAFLSLFLSAITATAVPSQEGNTLLEPSGSTRQRWAEPSDVESASPLTEEMIDLNDTIFTYDGTAHSPSINIKGDDTYTEGVDYTVSGTRSAKDANTYTIEISGPEANPFFISKNWTIAKREVVVKPTDTSKHIGLDDPTLSYTMEGVVEGDSILGISVTREAGEETGTYPISAHDEGLNPNYQINTSATGTFRIEGHHFERGENAVIENQVPSTCTQDGSHDEVYYCLFEACKAECLRIHVSDTALGHDFPEEFTIDIPASCERAGTQSRHCTKCNQRIENTLIPATGHSWSSGYISKDATCIEKGEMTYYCMNYPCQASRTEEIELIDHIFEENYTLDIPASCEKNGQESRHCIMCGEKTDIREIPAHGHSWDDGEVEKKATCTIPGIKLYHCMVDTCDGTKEEEIEPIGHDFIEEFITDTFPTCTKAGSKSWHCSRCREVDNITEIPARGHRWGDGDTTAFPTCETEGMILRTCVAYGCGATDTTYIPALGHAWDEGIVDKEPTCTEKGALYHICTREDCDATLTEEIEAMGHDFNQEYTIEIPATCTRSGKKSQHCSRCSETINNTLIPATGHAWGNPTTIIASTCTTSGLISYACIHDNCQQTRTQSTDKLNHEFAAKHTIDTEATCTHEGSMSRHCIRCNERIEIIEIPATGHMAGDTIIDRDVPATCTEPGEVSRAVFCQKCQAELWRSSTSTPAIGHDWDDGEFVIEPTTHNPGKKAFTCKNCREKKYELVEKLYEDIVMREFENGSIFSVKGEGYCPGSEGPISYTVLEGVPVDFRVEYSDQAKEQGFEDMDWTNVSADSRIPISTPEHCQAGVYQANVFFRNENMAVTKAYPVSFTVNLSNSFIVAIFDDVVSIDNRSELFHSYQWYHNDRIIYGATKPYYQEIGGLTGSYYVKVNTDTETEARTCSRDTWDELLRGVKSISVSQNPIKEATTVTLHNFEVSPHTLSVINQLGTTILTERFSEDHVELNTSSLPAGNYIINVDGTSLKVIKE
ncbi:MAG: T9SS type A sorting domain-containing protein [Paludibacteraceae bacterium]|nr:T9SS type A sorting domain-containing protein [Paludibacteraceae bacterium]